MIGNRDRPDSPGLLDEVDLYFEKLTDDREIGRRVPRQWPRAKAAGTRERDQRVSFTADKRPARTRR